jgi:lactoylglutathione lyase
MELHRGRLIDHVYIRVRDLGASSQFYAAVLKSLGIPVGHSGEKSFVADELYLVEADPPSQHLHLAFQAPDRRTVRRFHKAALEAGGTDNGEPGVRRYHKGYYAAYVLDPDGNNIEAVYHGPAERSAKSVTLVPRQRPGRKT